MNYEEHRSHAASELELAVQAVAAGASDAPVPTCPGWTVADLARHIGEFCGFWTHVLCEGSGRPKTPYSEPAEDLGNAGEWLEETGRELLGELAATAPKTEVWTWYEADRTAGFVARRAAHELAIHRYDAQAARGFAQPVPAPLAVDGIDEMLFALTVARPRSTRGSGKSLHIHSTDAEGEWLVELGAERLDVSRTHGKADLALRGDASDLELVLYRRPPLSEPELLGEKSVLESWYAEFTF